MLHQIKGKMKKFITFLLVLLLIAAALAAAAAGAFYKKATPTLLVDLSESMGKTSEYCEKTVSPAFKTTEELTADGGRLTSDFWTSKWCLEMNEKACRSIHYDFTDYDFKTYLKDLKSFDFKGFTGVASYNEAQNGIDIICKGKMGNAEVLLYGFGNTKLAGKTLEIVVEEAVFKGKSGETVLPVTLRDYTANASDKLKIQLSDIDEKNAYHIKIREADKSAAPAYENLCPPVRYAFAKDNSAEIEVNEDGNYNLDFVFGKCENEAYFEAELDGKDLCVAETFEAQESSCVSKSVKLKKGKHTLKLTSEETLPNFESVVISEVQENIYIVKNEILTSDSSKAYDVVVPYGAKYSVTSAGLTGNITVNSRSVTLNEMGAAAVKLNKGFNTVEFPVSSAVEFDITEIIDE